MLLYLAKKGLDMVVHRNLATSPGEALWSESHNTGSNPAASRKRSFDPHISLTFSLILKHTIEAEGMQAATVPTMTWHRSATSG